jgi:hypothetical protein
LAGVALAAIVVAGVILIRRRSARSAQTVPAPPEAPVRKADEPMTGLEAALAEVTDRDGRPIGERIEAEAEIVDDLRVPDDTGPLLRRALDRVEHDDVTHGDSDDDTPDIPDSS